MGRYRRRMFNDYQTENNNPDSRYDLAYKQVKRIKGFYVHFLVYILVNTFIIIANRNENFVGNNIFWSFETFSTALFWGIGLLAHGLVVFGRNMFFGKNWEERKIQQLMEKDKSEKWE